MNADEEEKPGPLWNAYRKSAWRPVDLGIWTRREEPAKGLRKVGRVLQRAAVIFTHPFSAYVLGTMAVGWSVIGTILAAYYLGGVRFFGPVFLAIWAAIIIGGILVIEKTGYARNFDEWNFSFRRTLVLPLAFALLLAFLYFIVLLGNHLP